MVCLPCFIIPLLLYIWHKFVQPIVLRYWNPWEKKDEQGNIIKAGPDFPFKCKGDVCPFVPGAGAVDKNKPGGVEPQTIANGNTEATTNTTPVTAEDNIPSKKDN